MGERHRKLVMLVGSLWLLQRNASKYVSIREVLDTAASSIRAHQYWYFWTDVDGVIHSEELQEDLEKLHERGYLYLNSDGTEVMLTKRSKLGGQI
jgi:hypothetical protein